MGEKQVKVPELREDQRYIVQVELKSQTNPNRNGTVQIFASTPEKAYGAALKVGSFYEDPDVDEVSFIGVYKRISLHVTEGE